MRGNLAHSIQHSNLSRIKSPPKEEDSHERRGQTINLSILINFLIYLNDSIKLGLI